MILSKLNVQKFYICLAFVVFAASAPVKANELDQLGRHPLKNPQLQNDPLRSNINPLQEALQPKDKKPLLDMNKILGNEKEMNVEGPRTGGGGNSCGLAVTQNTRQLMTLLKSADELPLSEDDRARLTKAIIHARFYLGERLILNGETKDAINYPDTGEIVLSQKFCQFEMIEVSGRSMGLLLHEYLGLARVDDKKYQVSGQFMELYGEMMDKHNRDKEILQKELRKDLKGQQSCFKGAIQEMKKSLWSDDIHPEDFVINVTDAGSSNSKGPKICSDRVDAKGHLLKPGVVSKYKFCDDYMTENLVATISYSAWSTNDRIDIVRVFKVTTDTRIKLKVDANASGLPDPEDIKGQWVTSTMTCKQLVFD